jgi:hypothetical protein
MTKLIKYILLSLLFTNLAGAQITIPITPPIDRPKTPVDPPSPRNPIPVRPDPSKPGGGDFDGKFYEYCGPSWLGYKCNFLRSNGVAKMRDVSTIYKDNQLASHQNTLDAATAKVDKDLASLRDGLIDPASKEGEYIKERHDAAKAHNSNATIIDNAALEVQKTAITQIKSIVDVSFGLAYKESDKKDYVPEETKMNLVIGERFIKSKIATEQERADAIETQIKNGVCSDKEQRLEMVGNGRISLEISAQSLQAGDIAKSNFALKVGTAFLDLSLSINPITAWPKDLAEATSGFNVITGEQLSGFERTMAWVGVFTGGVGSKLAIFGKAAVIIGIISKAKGAEKAAEAARVASKAEEFVESAASLKRFGPLEAGPLHAIKLPNGTVADTFRSSSYFELSSKVDTKLYRVYSSDGGRVLGPYWSRIKPSGPLQAQLDSALDPSWGNKATGWVEINVPAGNKFYEGAVSPVVLQSSGSKLPIGQLYGGGSQIYFDSFVDEGWITAKGVF